jgi:hypothetical protein
MIPGWPYWVIGALEPGRTSQTAVLDTVRRLERIQQRPALIDDSSARPDSAFEPEPPRMPEPGLSGSVSRLPGTGCTHGCPAVPPETVGMNSPDLVIPSIEPVFED